MLLRRGGPGPRPGPSCLGICGGSRSFLLGLLLYLFLSMTFGLVFWACAPIILNSIRNIIYNTNVKTLVFVKKAFEQSPLSNNVGMSWYY